MDAGCSLDCCYLYSAFSVNLTCSPSGSPISVTLQCAITLPDLTGVQVRWYRSETEELAGTRGELVDTAAGVTGVLESTPSPFSGLYTAVTSTHIKNFTFRDSGYYWCQLGVNSTCLLPSPPGLVELDSLPQETCDDNSTFANSKQFLSHSPVCALKEGTSFTLGSESTRTEMATFMATAMTGGSGEDEDALWYSVMGVVFFLVAMLSAALTLLVIVRVSRRRAAASQGKEKGTDHYALLKLSRVYMHVYRIQGHHLYA